MRRIKLTEGLNLPIPGAPAQVITEFKSVSRVAILGTYFPGFKPQLEVVPDAGVHQGQVLLRAKHDPRIAFTSPVSGKVLAINRGEKRAFVSLVVEVGREAPLTFPAYSAEAIQHMPRAALVEHLLMTGQWVLLRTRPFGKIPNPDTQPYAIFVTAMDTNPLAPDVAVILQDKAEAFQVGLAVMARLTEGKVYLCQAPSSAIPTANLPNLEVVEFAGPHPAGNVGTHIHWLAPVSRQRTVWYIDAQSVAAIGNFKNTRYIFKPL